MIKITIEGIENQEMSRTIVSKKIFEMLSKEGHAVSLKDKGQILFSERAIRYRNLGLQLPIEMLTRQVA